QVDERGARVGRTKLPKLIRSGVPRMLQRILVPLDGSGLAERVLTYVGNRDKRRRRRPHRVGHAVPGNRLDERVAKLIVHPWSTLGNVGNFNHPRRATMLRAAAWQERNTPRRWFR